MFEETLPHINILRICSSTCDPPVLTSSPDTVTCVKRAEQALLEYIKISNGSPDGAFAGIAESNIGEAAVEHASPRKRQKLTSSNGISLDSRSDDDNRDEPNDGAAHVPDTALGALAGSSIGEAAVERASPSERQRLTSADEISLDGRSDDDATNEEAGKQKIVAYITKKIWKGIQKKVPQRKPKKHTSSQLQIQLVSSDIPTSEIVAQFAAYTVEERSRCLESLLWKQVSTLLQGAHELAWKYSFIASCLHTLRETDPPKSENYNLYRWRRAIRLVNSIVNRLWEAWGPAAALVYEGLAGTYHTAVCDTATDTQPERNYSLSRISTLAEGMQEEIAIAVAANLSECSPLKIPLDMAVFHPAAYISTIVKLE